MSGERGEPEINGQGDLDRIYDQGEEERQGSRVGWKDAATLLRSARLVQVPNLLEAVGMVKYRSTGCPYPSVALGDGDLANSRIEIRGRTLVLENDNIFADYPIRKISLRILKLIRGSDSTDHISVDMVTKPHPNSARVEYYGVTTWKGWRFCLLVNYGEDDGTVLTTHYDEAKLLADIEEVEITQND